MIHNSQKILIVGLGNPGRKYKKTRHNVGFRILDEFRKEQGFLGFRIDKKFQAVISEGALNGEKVIMAKPQTFMNSSGKAVKSLTTYYKLQTTNLIIVHDDLDLPLGEIKISQNKGAAGHKGVASIIKELGTRDFTRLRLGIKPNSANYRSSTPIVEFVLGKFSKDEEKTVKQAIKKAGQALTLTITQGAEKAMSELNKGD